MYNRLFLFMRMSKPKTALFSLALIPVLITGYFYLPKSGTTEKPTKQRTENQAEEDTLITLIAVGDMMLGTNYPGPEYLPGNNIL